MSRTQYKRFVTRQISKYADIIGMYTEFDTPDDHYIAERRETVLIELQRELCLLHGERL
jgi:hypothetical protein